MKRELKDHLLYKGLTLSLMTGLVTISPFIYSERAAQAQWDEGRTSGNTIMGRITLNLGNSEDVRNVFADSPAAIGYSRFGSTISLEYRGPQGGNAVATFRCSYPNANGGWELVEGSLQGQCWQAYSNQCDSVAANPLDPTDITLNARSECTSGSAKGHCTIDSAGGSEISGNTGDDMFKILANSNSSDTSQGYFEYTRLGNISNPDRLRWIERTDGSFHPEKDVMMPSGPPGDYSDFTGFIDIHEGMPPEGSSWQMHNAKNLGSEVSITSFENPFYAFITSFDATTIMLPVPDGATGERVVLSEATSNPDLSGELVLTRMDYPTHYHVSAKDGITYDADMDSNFIVVNTGGQDTTVELPSAFVNQDNFFFVRKTDSSNGTVTVEVGTETLAELSEQTETVILASDGENWNLVEDNDLADNLLPTVIDDRIMLHSTGAEWMQAHAWVEHGCYPVDLQVCNTFPPPLSSCQVANSGDGGDGGDGGGDGGDGDPLVFDLDGDGIELVNLSQSDAFFDVDMKDAEDFTAWVAPDDALLVFDRNNDGMINDATELFGNVGGHLEGFSHLAELDSNQDGLISMDDNMFGNLQLWQDKNGDGISDGNELSSLMQMNISEINLTAEYVDNVINGQWESHRSTFTYADGTVGQVSDIWFNHSDVPYNPNDPQESWFTEGDSFWDGNRSMFQ